MFMYDETFNQKVCMPRISKSDTPSQSILRLPRHTLLSFVRVAFVTIFVWGLVAGLLVLSVHHYGLAAEAEEADVIVVLGAGLRRDGSAGFALTRRTNHAADLYQQGYADNIICTGGLGDGRTRTEAEACRDILLRRGVDPAAIFLEGRSRSTEENAYFSRQIIEANGWDEVLVVSDSYHLLRASWLFEEQGYAVHLGAVGPEQIRSRSSYAYSVLREVAALHWHAVKGMLGITITHIP